MGIGSPRLLTLLRCGCALAVAALWFTPSAFADGGVLLSASVSVGPVHVDGAVPEPPANAVPTPAAAAPTVPAPPVTTTPVSNAVAAPSAPTHVVTDLTRRGRTTAHAAVPVAHVVTPPPSHVATKPESFAEASAPARHSVHRGEPQSPRSGGHRPLPQGAGRSAGADAPPSPATRPTATWRPTGTTAHVASSMPPPNPQSPLPGSVGLTGAAGSTASTGSGVLLLAVAVTLGFLAFPQLARVITPCVARARPYPYLLWLERPD